MVTPITHDQQLALIAGQATIPLDALQRWVQGIRGAESARRAWIAGISATVLGVLLWVGVSVWLQYQIGAVALACGMLIGWGVRRGRGMTPHYGWIAVTLTAVCIFVAHLATLGTLAATQFGVSPWVLWQEVSLRELVLVAQRQFDWWDLALYGLALHWAYTGALWTIGDNELAVLAKTRRAA